jgi:hypothetical protein
MISETFIKYISTSIKHIEDHNKCKSHARFLKLQNITHLFKQLHISKSLLFSIEFVVQNFDISLKILTHFYA